MKEVIKIVSDKLNKSENSLIMVVGDSITWGEDHCTSEEAYCAELARLFGNFFPETAVLRYDGIMEDGAMPLKCYAGPITVQRGSKGVLTIVRSGVGGDSVRRAINRSQDYTGTFLTGESPDVFLVMLGINDAYWDDSSKYVTPDVFYSNYKELYEVIKKENSGAEIILMTPTYYDRGNTEKSVLEPYVEMVKKLAFEENLQMIDTHKLWMNHLIMGSEHNGQRDWLSEDDGDPCHFSPAGAKETAKFIFNELLKE